MVLLLWACFVVRGLFYCAATPAWEGLDEYAHFAYTQHLALEKRLPATGANVSREVADSLALLPLPWALRNDLRQVAHLTHDDYWRLPEQARAARRSRFAALRPGRQGEMAAAGVPAYERQQPPLYYALLSPPYLIARGWSLAARIWWLRFIGLLIASVAVPLVYLLARRITGSESQAVATAAVAVSMPGLLLNAGRVSNEALAIALGSAMLLAAVRFIDEPSNRRTAAVLGITLGAALLTKSYFLTAALAVAALITWRSVNACLTRSPKRSAVLWNAVIVSGVALVLAGPLYVQTFLRTGALSSEQHHVAASGLGAANLLGLAWRAGWWTALDSTSFSYVWTGGWSFLTVRSWMYHVFYALFALAAGGLVWTLLRERHGPRRTGVAVLMTFCAAFALGLAYHIVAIFSVHGTSAAGGWYLYALVAAEAVLLVAGLQTVLRRWAAPVLAVCFFLIEMFALHFYQLPYYSGLIAHRANGTVGAFDLPQFLDWFTVLSRLCENKPGIFHPAVMAMLWVAFLIASAAVVAACLAAVREPLRSHRNASDVNTLQYF